MSEEFSNSETIQTALQNNSGKVLYSTTDNLEEISDGVSDVLKHNLPVSQKLDPLPSLLPKGRLHFGQGRVKTTNIAIRVLGL